MKFFFYWNVICLSGSSVKDDRDQAKLIVSEKLNVIITEKKVSIGDLNSSSDIEILAFMLDAYHKDNEHQDALRITEALKKQIPENSIVLRNYARALDKVNKPGNLILKWYRKALYCIPTDVITAKWYALKLKQENLIVDVVEVAIFACLLNVDRPESFAFLAVELSNLIQPQNTFILVNLKRKVPGSIDATLVIHITLLCESCNDYVYEHKIACEKALKNVGKDGVDRNNFYLNYYKGGDISRPDRAKFLYKLYNVFRSNVTDKNFSGEDEE